jgi:hypothetical protein
MKNKIYCLNEYLFYISNFQYFRSNNDLNYFIFNDENQNNILVQFKNLNFYWFFSHTNGTDSIGFINIEILKKESFLTLSAASDFDIFDLAIFEKCKNLYLEEPRAFRN